MRSHYGERGDVAVGDAVGGLFFHFGEDVAYDLGRVIGCLWGTGDLDSSASEYLDIEDVYLRGLRRVAEGEVGCGMCMDCHWRPTLFLPPPDHVTNSQTQLNIHSPSDTTLLPHL